MLNNEVSKILIDQRFGDRENSTTVTHTQHIFKFITT